MTGVTRTADETDPDRVPGQWDAKNGRNGKRRMEGMSMRARRRAGVATAFVSAVALIAAGLTAAATADQDKASTPSTEPVTVFIGDGTASPDTGTGVTGENLWTRLVSDAAGADEVNVATAGAGFTSGHDYATQLEDALSAIDKDGHEPSDVTAVYVIGGWNDANGAEDNTADAIDTARETAERIRNAFPNAAPHYIPETVPQTRTNKDRRTATEPFMDELAGTMAKAGYDVADEWWDWLPDAYANGYAAEDDIHATAKAQTVIADKVKGRAQDTAAPSRTDDGEPPTDVDKTAVPPADAGGTAGDDEPTPTAQAEATESPADDATPRAAADTITLTYDPNGGKDTIPPVTTHPNYTIRVTTETPERDGYAFTGWNTKQDGTGAMYRAYASFLMTKDTTLYAQWTAPSCEPFSMSDKICDSSIPRHTYHIDGNGKGAPTIPAERSFYQLSTIHFNWANVQFDDNWVPTGGMVMDDGTHYYPKNTNATVTLRNTGTWTSTDGKEYTVEARISLIEKNNGLNVANSNNGFWLSIDDCRSPQWRYDEMYTPVDASKRCGGTVRITFLDQATGNPMPAGFSGFIGLDDLDGAMSGDMPNENNEGWELISSGFDGIYYPDDNDLKEFGTNGLAGNKETADGDQSSVSAARHRFLTTFDSNTITMRYSAKLAGHAPFGADAISKSIDYQVEWTAVDENGKKLTIPGMTGKPSDLDKNLPDTVKYGGSWDLRGKHPDLTKQGYDYVGLREGSDPENGTIGRTNMRNQRITWEYRKRPGVTGLPQTGAASRLAVITAAAGLAAAATAIRRARKAMTTE